MDTSNIVEGPRPKRHKESSSNHITDIQPPASKSPSPAPAAPKIKLKLKKQGEAGGKTKGGSAISEMGMKIWNTVKQAKDAR